MFIGFMSSMFFIGSSGSSKCKFTIETDDLCAYSAHTVTKRVHRRRAHRTAKILKFIIALYQTKFSVLSYQLNAGELMIPVLGDADQVCEWASFGGAGTMRRCTGLMQGIGAQG